jgi:hypothetical protein
MKTSTLLIAILLAVGLHNNYAQNTWSKKASIGGGVRHGAVGFSIGSKGYIGAGVDTPGHFRNDFWEYDPSTNAWAQKADFGGTARYYAVGFSIGSKGYIGTGYDSSFKNDFWEYDPGTNTWKRKADFGGMPRYHAVGFSIGGKGYIGTGLDSSDKNDFWQYDPSTNTWAQKANFGGNPRWGAVGFSIGSKGYIGTGVAGSLVKDFWEYDPSTDTWTQKADFGGERYTAIGFSIGSNGYIGTGAFSNRYKTYYYNDLWEYHPGTNTWIQKASFGGRERRAACGFSIGSKGYLGTGLFRNSNLNDFWEYTPENTCLSPGGLKAILVSDTFAILRWDTSAANVLFVQFRYRAAGDIVWLLRKEDASENRKHIYGLMPGTTYQWQARSMCAEDTSGWVKGPDFTTAASFAFSSTTSTITSRKLPGNIHVQVMPNPNKGDFTIQLQLPAEAAITTLALYNNMGEKVWQQDAGKISGAVYKNISLQSQLPAGTYMMVVQRDDVRLMQKIVINK